MSLKWILFNIFVAGMLALDLFVFNRKDHEVKVKESLLWTLFWILLALAFNAGIWWFMGKEPALKFLTGYLLEKSLSVDNLFVFLIIFSYFHIPLQFQHRVLFWGILGAVLMRGVFIGCGIALIHAFYWIMYLLGAFLVVTGIKLFFEKEKEIEPDKNWVINLFRKLIPVTKDLRGNRFFLRENGRLWATPLFVTLLVIDITDVVFATDSIPAILSITTDPFLVYTSNVFAILGLRALYFALAGAMQLFRFLNYGLGAILIFVGAKMVIADFIKIPTHVALLIVGGILAVSVLASLLAPERRSGHS